MFAIEFFILIDDFNAEALTIEVGLKLLAPHVILQVLERLVRVRVPKENKNIAVTFQAIVIIEV